MIEVVCFSSALQREQPPDPGYAHGDQLVHAAAIPPCDANICRPPVLEELNHIYLMIGKCLCVAMRKK
jgi:hypothetical protein